MSTKYKDLVVWITGASSGIGRALAREVATRGASVVVSARRLDRLETLVNELRELGAPALAVPCDVTSEAEIAHAVRTIEKEFGRLDVAVANAGFGVSGKIRDLTADDWNRQLGTNVVGAAMTARYALPELEKTGGRMVFVGSVMSMMVAPGNGLYAASKYAVRALGQALAMESHGTGVSVTTLHPGFVTSEIGQVDNKGVFEASRTDPRPQGLMWPTEKAARVMANAIYARKREFTFTGHGKVAGFLGRHVPSALHFAMTRKAAQPSA